MHSECHAEVPFNCPVPLREDAQSGKKVPISSELCARDARLDHAGEVMTVMFSDGTDDVSDFAMGEAGRKIGGPYGTGNEDHQLQTLHFLAVWALEKRCNTERNHGSVVSELRS